MIEYEKRAMIEAEDKYTFRQSSQISGQTGLIGYLLEKGITQKEIAQRLGYKTHSAVSKRMKIMNKDFKEFLGFEN